MDIKIIGILLVLLYVSATAVQEGTGSHCHVPMMCKDDTGVMVPSWTDVESSPICKNTHCDCTKLIEDLKANVTRLENALAAFSSTTPRTTTTTHRGA